MDEVQVARMLGQGGTMGVIAYVLIRYGPTIETLIIGRHRASRNTRGRLGDQDDDDSGAMYSRQHSQAQRGDERSERNVSWGSLVDHCDREHKRNAELTASRFKALEETVGDLREDIRDGLKTLHEKIDRRWNGVPPKG